MAVERFADYDPFAWIYNTHWGHEFHSQSMAVLDRLLLRDLPAQAHILDLCCGVGHLTEQLVKAGFHVTGLEGSEEMLQYARRRVPGCRLLLGDARAYELDSQVDAVVCTFDSLNHVMLPEDLRSVFVQTFRALRPGGCFVFDVNREEAYRTLWVRGTYFVEPDRAQIAQGSYDAENRVATCDVTVFRFADGWQRSDFTLRQKCYTRSEFQACLRDAGFTDIRHYDARDLGMKGDIAYGRSFYKCLRP